MSSRRDQRSSKYDTGRDRDRDRRRRHRSPSYDSYDSESSYTDSEYSRSPSPPRRSSRKTRSAYSDSEDHRRGRDRERRGRYYEEESESPTRRNVVEDLLAAIGLVRDKNKSKGQDGKSDRSVAKRGDREGLSAEDKKKAQKQALQAALTAAAVEAFKTRKEGGLTPQRLMQIAAAAIAAGGLDVLVDRNPNNNSMRHVIESVVAGLAAGKTVGGQVKHKRPDSVRGKVGGGMIGMATKQLLSRSMSRGGKKRKD